VDGYADTVARMKKIVMLLVLLLLAGLAALPAVVGWLLHERLEIWANENAGQVTLTRQSGWLRSSARVSSDGFDLDLRFRHLSWKPPAWLTLEGMARLDSLQMPFAISGRLAGAGTLYLDAAAPALELPGQVVWRYREPRLGLVASRGGYAMVTAGAANLAVFDGLGNQLALEQAGLAFDLQMDDASAAVSLDVQARRIAEPESRLQLALTGIDRSALGTTLEQLRLLISAEPESRVQAMAMLGVLNGWQEIVQGGLQMQHASLALDGDFNVDGEWQPGAGGLRLRGGGDRQTAREWWAAVVGLSQQMPPAAAGREVDARLQELAGQGWLKLGRDRIELAPVDGMPEVK
ncbi:MAG: hypothetical protein ACNA7E_11225, partial [Wenzhouxiangellaceae bacterium]